ncbi:hypothetical protein BGZ57DRAFT_862765 [Hyaloscypha finlandica]|nr:hypothetical protein BGZ57DRAFT_862765 [Hyaloscypha finlandica]
MERNNQFSLQTPSSVSYEILPLQELVSKPAPMLLEDESVSPPVSLIDRKSLSKNITTTYAFIEGNESSSSSSRHLKTGLQPKAFFRASLKRRILVHVATALGFFLSLCIPLAMILPIIIGTTSGQTKQSSMPIHNTWCSYGDYGFDGYLEPMSFSTVLNIDRPFGVLSFGMAKFIDLVWDIVISRGGQALLGWITYTVYTAALMKIMETHIVSYDLYASLTLSPPTLSTIVPVTKGLFRRLGFRRNLLLFWVMLSIAFVSLWPTITNAMTGYVPLNDAMVLLKGQNASVYADYSNISATSNLAFQFVGYYGQGVYEFPTNSSPIYFKDGPNTTLWTDMYQAVWSINDMERPIHSLDYIIGPRPVGLLPNATYQQDGAYFNPEIPWGMSLISYFYFEGQYYHWEYFQNQDNMICIQTNNYGWGFASTYGVWVHINCKSEMSLKGRVMDKYRAVTDLSEAMRNDLGDRICAYTGKELSQELDKIQGVKYVVIYEIEERFPHIVLSSKSDGEGFKLEFGTLYGDRKDK